jgi:aminopeptidase N
LLVVLVAGAAAIASAQERRQSRIDVEDYAIQAQVNPATQSLTAKVTVRFTPLDDQINSLVFELNNALNVSRITDGKGQQISGSRNSADQSIQLSFPNSLTKGQAQTLTFEYDGRLTGNEESPIYGIKFAAITPEVSFLLYPGRWFPVSGYTADRFTATIDVTVPAGYVVVGSGTDTHKPGPNGSSTTSFQVTRPTFPGNIAVLRGTPVKSSAAGVTTTLWFRGPQAGFANEWGAETGEMVAYFTDKFGLPPAANLTVVQTLDGAPNGYAAPGLIFVAPGVITKEVNGNVLSNQVARQWWEEETSPANRNHLWLENGMALYAEALWTEKDKGAAALEQRMRDTSITALTIDNVPLIQTSRLEDYSPEYWALSASKGAAVIHMLRATMGDDKFFSAVKQFVSSNAWKPVSTDDFRKACEAAYGEDLRYFFIQWVESSGTPEFKLEYTIFRTTKGFRVTGKISQDLDLFRMPVDLHIETEGNPEDKRVDVMGSSSEFSVDTFGKPKKVTIDPANKVLRLNPQIRVEVAVRKGEQFTQIGEYADALREFQKALDTQRNSSMAHYRVAEVFFQQHNYQSSANEFREALIGDNNPKWVEVWSHIYLGKIFDITGQRERAVNEYTQAQRTRDNTQGAQDEVAKLLKTPYQQKSDTP